MARYLDRHRVGVGLVGQGDEVVDEQRLGVEARRWQERDEREGKAVAVR